MKNIGLALHWLVLLTLLVIQLLGIVSSIGTATPLRLTKGAGVEVSVFRLYPTPLHFRLEVNKQNGANRPELGEVMHTAPISGSIRFDNPGEAIKILATTKLGSQLHEMFPEGCLAFEKEKTSAIRSFEPFVEDGDPAAYPWPPANHLRPILPAGFSTVKFSVVQAGSVTASEEVKLYIAPPLEPKEVHTMDYMWLAWATLLWPFTLFGLLIYGWYLLKTARQPVSR